jgi:hypothetical protein
MGKIEFYSASLVGEARFTVGVVAEGDVPRRTWEVLAEQDAERGVADDSAASVLGEMETFGLGEFIVREQRPQRLPASVGYIEIDSPDMDFAGGKLRDRAWCRPVGHGNLRTR